jgi:hypothetical protein
MEKVLLVEEGNVMESNVEEECHARDGLPREGAHAKMDHL